MSNNTVNLIQSSWGQSLPEHEKEIFDNGCTALIYMNSLYVSVLKRKQLLLPECTRIDSELKYISDISAHIIASMTE